MARFTDPAAFNKHLSERLEHWKQAVQVEHEALVKAQVEDMQALLSGTVPTKQLVALGHPFARRSGGRKRGRVPSLPINRQTGRLKRSLRRKTLAESSRITYEVSFTAPYAKYVLSPSGTRKMVGRGYWREVTKLYKKRKAELVRRVRRSGLR